MDFTSDNGNFHNVSLGQGQEVVAEQKMELAAKEGHWVVLQVSLKSLKFIWHKLLSVRMKFTVYYMVLSSNHFCAVCSYC